jgi:hypothetical protein
MKNVVTLMAMPALAVAPSFAPVASAHEGDEAEEASSEHFLGVNWDAPWLPHALVISGLAVVGVAVYATQRK